MSSETFWSTGVCPGLWGIDRGWQLILDAGSLLCDKEKDTPQEGAGCPLLRRMKTWCFGLSV